MPNRYIRDGLISSEPFNALSWRDQNFYVRLLLLIDDYGCYDASPAILRAVLYPLLLDKMSTADVASCLANCEQAGLVSTYTVGGKDYLHVPKFKQFVRAKHRKWPAPPAPPPPPCNAPATHLQCTCNAHATHMQSYNDKPHTIATGDNISPAKQKRELCTTTPPPTPTPPPPNPSRSPQLTDFEQSWLAAMCQTRRRLAAMDILPENVLKAALAAAHACPDAPDYADKLRRYYAADDNLVPYPPNYRPTSFEKMFRDLPDVLEWACKWCDQQDALAQKAARRAARRAAQTAAEQQTPQQTPEQLAYQKKLWQQLRQEIGL